MHSLFKTHLLVSLADGSENHLLVTHDVLLVLSFPVNLLSVKKLCSKGSCQVIFTSTCVFHDTKRREIGHGSSDGTLYYLQPI